MTTKDGKQHHHRSSLKQQNKPFKGSSARSKSRGRIESSVRSASVGKPGRTLNSATMTKSDRRNHANILQAAKRAELNQERRMFSGKSGVPKNIVFVALSPSVILSQVVCSISNSLEENSDFVTYFEEHRQNLRWITTQFNDWNIMDTICSGDIVVLVVDARDEEHIDAKYFELLTVIRSQGISSAIGLVQNGDSLSKQKKSEWQQFFQIEMSTISKVYFNITAEREHSELIRSLCSQRLNGISWRERRPYLVIDGQEVDQATGFLKVIGFSRGGQPFSANRLVHIPSIGTFEVDRITLVPLSNNGRDGSEGMEVDCLQQIADSLLSEKISDEILSQTICMEMEGQDSGMMSIIDAPVKAKKRVKVPKGTSSYQAAWLPDVTEITDEEGEEEEVELSDRESIKSDSEDEQKSTDEMEEDDPHEREAHRISPKLAKDFPDLIQLDGTQPARVQLANYRGLQSLRSAHWDPEENLPAEYEHIYQFENPSRSMHKAMQPPIDTPFCVGQKICIWLKGLPSDVTVSGKVMYGLLPHEQRTSLLHFTVTPRDSELVNREEVVAWIGGIRRFVVEPLLSENNPSSALFRQLSVVEPGQTAIASIYAPIHYTGPVLLFSLEGRLLSVGSVFAGADPRRIVLQRSTLTGAPYKIHKRAAVVRWMFDNPADVLWFKPLELCTKSGRRGHIKESLGTHGHFKALFDKPLLSNESIAMNLYKRVFPRWNSTRPI